MAEDLEALLARLKEANAQLSPGRALSEPALSPSEEEPGGIGTLGEKQLHAVLKQHYCTPGALQEVSIDGYVADIAGPDGIVEIQTRGLSRLRKKLETFLAHAPVTVVYPIPRHKWVCWIDPATGETGPRRKSPKTGTPYHAFPELYGLRPLLTHPGLHVRLVLLDMEEYRFLDGRGPGKRKGATKGERVPLSLVEEVRLDSPADYVQLIPPSLPSLFTSRDFAAAARLRLSESQTALNILHTVGVLRRVGKEGRLYLYERK